MRKRNNPFPKRQRKELDYDSQTSSLSPTFDFSNQNADGEDLSGLDLRHVNFESASLVGVDFTGSDLEGVNLKGADIRNANFTDVDLRKANLAASNIDGVTFEKTDLSGANLAFIGNIINRVHKFEFCNVEQALVTDREFIEAIKFLNEKGSSWLPEEFQHLRDTQGHLKENIEDCSFDDFVIRDISIFNLKFERVSFVGTSFINCDLRGSLFKRTDFTNASFINCDLRECRFFSAMPNLEAFDRSNIEGTMFKDDAWFLAYLQYKRGELPHLSIIGVPRFEELRLINSDLQGADLKGMVIRYSYFVRANLQGANLSQGDFYGSNFFLVNLSGANLRDADLRDADLRGTDLSEANLNGAMYNKNTRGLTKAQKTLMLQK